ncbi:hypothetical protein [Streptomyces sp. NBC_01217]|uniref:hypothetical protein n=1 Tax=Streptomyces sp. NBC_01217 TaxID=2903779 RepID=UPI002E164A3A|nr:hypothetical protein OG507_34595 [Streptomyces sp. NBC_01217]
MTEEAILRAARHASIVQAFRARLRAPAMTPSAGSHPTVLVRLGSLRVQIDEQLASTIWECGFETFTCCQDLEESNGGT